MGKMVTLKVDDRPVSVPEGTLVVDAAKKCGVDIPVFCYHPKLDPVGMCRMCLVEIGRPVVDRTTGEVVKDANGSPKLTFGPKLETACTVPVSEGMVVLENTDRVKAARREMLEFLLTSHPLDCPICDKGGECPLQNLTRAHGPGESRYLYADKMHLAKRVPLGDLIWLDRERCIQCARCVRFQDEIVDDPVIGFYQRGRALEIITHSEPGFDSIFSGNTSDICPVGALTTADFRFGARPWELNAAASICPHCPVGCNLTLNTRREAAAGGRMVIKRVMPRQNETVNETWICDKGRFGTHYTASDQRLVQPLLRRGGELVPVTWEEAVAAAGKKLAAAGAGLVTLAGGRLSNEDLFNLRQLTDRAGGLKRAHSFMSGGDRAASLGLPEGSNLSALGRGSAILVASCDLHAEAPLWWLRIKQAVRRGATLVVANARPTRLEKYAAHVVRSTFGSEAAALAGLLPGKTPADGSALKAAEALASAENLVVFYGSDGLGLAGSATLADSLADLLEKTGHAGKLNSGLVPVWHAANLQGAWEMGFRPSTALAAELAGAKVALIAAADPAGDDPALQTALRQTGFLVVQELFLTETARMADVVLPALPFTEREGSLTSGERIVQHYYPALPPRSEALPDFTITARLAKALGMALQEHSAGRMMLEIASALPAFARLTYQSLSASPQQWPIIGRQDLYYGGTSYENRQGVGVRLALVSTARALAAPAPAVTLPQVSAGGVLALPVTVLYDRGETLLPSALLHARLAKPELRLHPATAAGLGLAAGGRVQVSLPQSSAAAEVVLDDGIPPGAGLLPRSLGFRFSEPAAVTLEKLTVENRV